MKGRDNLNKLFADIWNNNEQFLKSNEQNVIWYKIYFSSSINTLLLSEKVPKLIRNKLAGIV